MSLAHLHTDCQYHVKLFLHCVPLSTISFRYSTVPVLVSYSLGIPLSQPAGTVLGHKYWKSRVLTPIHGAMVSLIRCYMIGWPRARFPKEPRLCDTQSAAASHPGLLQSLVLVSPNSSLFPSSPSTALSPDHSITSSFLIGRSSLAGHPRISYLSLTLQTLSQL